MNLFVEDALIVKDQWLKKITRPLTYPSVTFNITRTMLCTVNSLCGAQNGGRIIHYDSAVSQTQLVVLNNWTL